MADAVKNLLDGARIRALGALLRKAEPGFPLERFVRDATDGLDALELFDRARHIAAALQRALPADFPRAAEVVRRSLGPPGAKTPSPLVYLPVTLWVSAHGLGNVDVALALQRELTKRFTVEFSLRPFLEEHPGPTLAALSDWAEDPDPEVRRAVSEATRPRLPWAPRLRRFAGDPAPIVALLERLVDDPELYVRRSVANHVGDLHKDHPALALALCRRWLEAETPARRWIVKHALRLPAKHGDPEALALLGFGGRVAVRVEGEVRPGRVALGGSVSIEVRLTSTARAEQALSVDLAVHYVKARGDTSRKVFKGRKLRLAPGAEATLTKRLALVERTIRTHHPGVHVVEALVNGRAFPLGRFNLAKPTAPPTRRPAPRRPRAARARGGAARR